MTGDAWSAHEVLESLVEALDEVVLVYDEALICRFAGPRVFELFGIQKEDLVGAPRSEVLSRVAALCDHPEPVMALAADRRSTVARPVELAGPRGRIIAWTIADVVRGEEQIGRVDVIREVTAERQAERELREMAVRLEEVSTIDALTGLPNRKRFEQECDREHRRAHRAWDSYAVARIDIDQMSKVNERHGRTVGDELLRALAEQLRSARREYDLIARWDGDEFILLIPGASATTAKTVVARALDCMQGKATQVAGRGGVTLSAGAALWQPPSDERAEDIIRRAGGALDRARAQGPGSIEVDGTPPIWKREET